ncbi:hypothetical protein MRX96_034225 [Rhipicephalus microplus]
MHEIPVEQSVDAVNDGFAAGRLARILVPKRFKLVLDTREIVGHRCGSRNVIRSLRRSVKFAATSLVVSHRTASVHGSAALSAQYSASNALGKVTPHISELAGKSAFSTSGDAEDSMLL